MQFEEGHIYHIYNQGNNRQKIFFERENYLFFLKKMGEHLLPHCNILAWCLMPNHFHWMVEVTKRDIVVAHGLSQSNLASGNHPAKSLEKLRSINDSIGILLRSYTRAINKAHKKSGSLFRPKTKAECLTCIDGITPAFFNTKYGTIINIKDPEKEYLQQCFNYIHENPVKAGMVKNAIEWEFSSCLDYYGKRNGKLINRERAKKILYNSSDDFKSSDE